jgi:hypothetical protein
LKSLVYPPVNAELTLPDFRRTLAAWQNNPLPT